MHNRVLGDPQSVLACHSPVSGESLEKGLGKGRAQLFELKTLEEPKSCAESLLNFPPNFGTMCSLKREPRSRVWVNHGWPDDVAGCLPLRIKT